MLIGFPCILRRNLTNMIITSYDFFKNLIQFDKKMFIAITSFLGILTLDMKHYLAPNFGGLGSSNFKGVGRWQIY